MFIFRFFYILFRKVFPFKPSQIKLRGDWKTLKKQCKKEVPKHSKRYWTRKRVKAYEIINASSIAYKKAEREYLQSYAELTHTAEAELKQLETNFRTKNILLLNYDQERRRIINQYKRDIFTLLVQFQNKIHASLFPPLSPDPGSFVNEPEDIDIIE